MKLEVLTTFRDKETDQLILAGAFFETDDIDRSKDLIKRGLVKSNEKTSTIKKEKEKSKSISTNKKSGE